MTTIIEKISTYQMFTNLLHGVFYIFCRCYFLDTTFPEYDVHVQLALFYIVGVIVNRFSSIVIERVLTKKNFIQFADLKKFKDAVLIDPKIETLSEVNNSYRGMISAILLLPFDLAYNKCLLVLPELKLLLWFSLLIIFLFSYKKQTQYIKDSVENVV